MKIFVVKAIDQVIQVIEKPKPAVKERKPIINEPSNPSEPVVIPLLCEPVVSDCIIIDVVPIA